MAKLKFRIHPLFLLIGIASIFLGVGEIFLCYLVTVLLHEMGHAVVAKHLGYELQQISVLPFGAELSLQNDNFTPKDEIKIAVAGPLVNLVLIIIFVALWWIFPTSYYYTDLFVFSNFVTLVFNLLPVFPLDGGRVYRAIVSKYKDTKTTEKIVGITAITLSLLFFLVFIISLFIQPLYSMALASIFLLTGAFNFNKNAIYKRRIFTKNYHNNFSKGCNVSIIAVSDTMPLYKLVKFINSQTYTIFVVYDSNNNLKKIIMEKNLNYLFTQYNSFAILKDII